MENQANSKSIILNYGLILGAISLLPSLIKYAMGGNYLENDMVSGVIGVALTIAFIIFAFKKYKESNNGFMSWGQGVKIGMGIILISMIITITYLLIFTNFIEPDFQTQALDIAQQKWVDAGMTEEQIETTRTMADKYFNLSLYGSITVMSLLLGFVISAITAAIMKKSEEEAY